MIEDNRKLSFLFSIFQFFPLSVFVGHAFWEGPPASDRWLHSFMISGLVALGQFIVLSKSPKPFNRLILGANVYLMFGGFSAAIRWLTALELLNALREVGVLLSMLFVGLVATLSTSAGFIGIVNDQEASKIKRLSLIMIFATLLGLLLSIFYKGNFLVSAVLPITALGIVNKALGAKVADTSRAAETAGS
jgi:hypothetical protein